MVRKTYRVKHEQVSSEVAPPPGLAPPPGNSAPAPSSRNKVVRRLVDAELASAGFPPGLPIPAGLAAPPGLETIAEDVATSDSTTAGESTPPSPTSCEKSSFGTMESEVSEEMHRVQLIGLPNQILSDPMFQAVLQQAQLNGQYTSFTTRPGKPYGEALVNLVSHSAAEWCAYHFHSRVWTADGVPVEAKLLDESSAEQEATVADPSADEAWLETWFIEACAMKGVAELGEAELGEVWFPEATPQRPSASFSADAPAFMPSSVGLSAEARVFVPGKKSLALDQRCTNNSDVSTVDGESESDEDKAAVIEVIAC